MRGRTHGSGGDFWVWRDAMYALAAGLEPDTYRALARAVYAEMALAGVTCVGEFHYVHHRTDGSAYDDPNAMGDAIRAAALDAGVRLTLIDACYLAGGLGKPLSAPQRRFGDENGSSWRQRVGARDDDANTRIAVAAHSVRAVSPDDLETVVVAAGAGRPLHVHLSEQPAENEASLRAYGLTPTALLRDRGVLGPATTVVHATHLTADDVATLGEAGVTACFCPTTERDLGDGFGPARALADAGASLALGSDQNAVVDLLTELQALEFDERLASRRRGRFSLVELVDGLTVHGHRALGWPEAGRIAAGSLCDLVAVRTTTPRTAGADPAQLPLVATAADVSDVIVGSRPVVRNGTHTSVRDVGRALDDAIAALS